MSMFHRAGKVTAILAGSAFALSTAALTVPAVAASSDRDHDGMPNRWESRHGLNPNRNDARGDKDHDGLRNLAEFKHHSNPRDEDSDNDGVDDGDEVHDGNPGTRLHDRDSDDDGVRDGDEDADHDGIDNEDEDDNLESCIADDDDSDHDGLSDEDENEHGTSAHNADSDDDGVVDGDDDSDNNGQADEDDDDHGSSDHCEDDAEDNDDFVGTIVSYDAGNGSLVLNTGATTVTYLVTGSTEIKYDGDHGGTETDESALVPDAVVEEVDVADGNELDEIDLAPPA